MIFSTHAKNGLENINEEFKKLRTELNIFRV
jgi:hypothetical protein